MLGFIFDAIKRRIAWKINVLAVLAEGEQAATDLRRRMIADGHETSMGAFYARMGNMVRDGFVSMRYEPIQICGIAHKRCFYRIERSGREYLRDAREREARFPARLSWSGV